jgi:hypothetical protein
MWKYLIVFVLFFQIIYAQSFEKKSSKITFSIKVPPPDIEPPVLKLIKPVKYGNFPIYSRDTIYTVAGTIDENSNKTLIVVNNISRGYIPNGPFKYDVKLIPGKNLIPISASDKKGNITRDTLIVIQDNNSESNPPIVKITQPKIQMQRGIKVVSKFETNDSMLTFKGKISDESEILGIWVNKEKVTEFNEGEFVFHFNQGFPDSVLIEAADKYGNLYSEVITSSKERLAEGTGENIKYYALIVTVEEYRDKRINSLDNPVKDGEKLKNVLINNYTFDEKNVHQLKNPTRAEITSEFQKLRKTLGANDNLLIFYAGHGHWDEEIQQGYWLPSDANADNPNNWIANSMIKDYIKGFKTKHTLLIADACFSGNFFRSINDQKNSEVAFQEIYKYPSRTAMTSGTKSDKVPDKSVFIEYLIQRLETNQEKYWQADQLFQSLKSKVRFNTPDNQVPAYGIIQETGDEGGLGDFIFVRK